MNKIIAIVAIADNEVIGNNNQLPWHLPEDLKRFRQLTTGHPIIMGRKTFDSIGKALPGRTNIVISRQKNLDLPEPVVQTHSMAEAIGKAQNSPGSDEIFVIGGAEIYRMAKPVATHCYVTRVHMNAEGETKLEDFPGRGFNLVETSEIPVLTADSPKASFQVFERSHFL